MDLCLSYYTIHIFDISNQILSSSYSPIELGNNKKNVIIRYMIFQRYAEHEFNLFIFSNEHT